MESMADSEVTQSSDSLSLPSEPPDIRNWFSSYQYDSFVLDTCDDAFRSRGRKDPSDTVAPEKGRADDDDDDGNLSERREIGELGNGSEYQTFSEAPESLSSPAFHNARDHPENWISTYVSDSGGLDPDAELETPAIWESQGNEGAAFIKEVLEKPPSSDESIANEFRFREGNEDSPLRKAPESSDSPAFINAPDHPENWLSSYVPDSGGLDPDDELETGAAIWESQGNEDGFIKEGINRKDNFESSEKESDKTLEKPPSSDEFVAKESQFPEGNEDNPLTKDPLSQPSSAFLSEPPDIRNWFSSYAYESPALGEESNPFVKSESQHTKDCIINRERNEDAEMKYQCIDMDQENIDGEVKLDALLHYDSPSRIRNPSHLLDSDMNIPKAMVSLQGYKIQNNDEKSATEKPKAAESDESSAMLIAESCHVRKTSDHEAKNAASSTSSGFVTTKKKNRVRRLNHDENSYHGSMNVAAKCFKSESRKSGLSSYGNAANEDDTSGNRKALSERRTNIVVQQSEVTGKWKCPQRSKPVKGPPLKQLRLEKWVTRL